MIEKFKSILKKEIFYYLLILLILALIMHSDLITDPVARVQLMNEKGNYTHPFLYAFIIYITILVFRKIIDFVMSLFEKKVN
jgi:hypothetical protein